MERLSKRAGGGRIRAQAGRGSKYTIVGRGLRLAWRCLSGNSSSTIYFCHSTLV